MQNAAHAKESCQGVLGLAWIELIFFIGGSMELDVQREDPLYISHN